MARFSRYKNSISLMLMILLTCTTQVMTIMKSSIVAGYFGTSTEMDAYNFANSIVSFAFGFVGAGISTVIIPGYIHNKDRKSIDSFITLLYGFMIFVVVVIILLRYHLIGLISSREDLFINLACDVIIILFLAQYLSSITNITVAYFQCKGRYNIPKVINLFAQILVVCALMIFKNITIIQYTWIISAGLIFNFIIDTSFAVKIGWRYHPHLIFNEETKNLFKLLLPIIFSTGVYKLSLMVDSTIASRLDTGYVTILSYSSQISTMVNTVLIGNLLIYCYPKIVARIKNDGNQSIFWEQASFFHLVVWLVIAGFIAVGQNGISLLFQHGRFNASDTLGVFYGALIYIIGQQTNIVRDLIYRYFYAKGDTKTPASNSVIVSAVNISVSLILVYFIGFYGIILGTVIASFFSLIAIMVRFKNKIGYEVPVRKIIFSFLRNILIAALTIIPVMITRNFVSFSDSISGNIYSILFFGFETVIIYVLLSLALKRNLPETIRNI